MNDGVWCRWNMVIERTFSRNNPVDLIVCLKFVLIQYLIPSLMHKIVDWVKDRMLTLKFRMMRLSGQNKNRTPGVGRQIS